MKCSKCGTAVEPVKTTLGKLKLVEVTYVHVDEGKGPCVAITDAGHVIRGRRVPAGQPPLSATRARLEHTCGGGS